MNDTTRDAPLTGLAGFLRQYAQTSAAMFSSMVPTDALRKWADEVDAARRAACSSLPDGPVADERAALTEDLICQLVRADRSWMAAEAKTPKDLVECVGCADRVSELRQRIRAALSAVSLPDGGAAEREVPEGKA